MDLKAFRLNKMFLHFSFKKNELQSRKLDLKPDSNPAVCSIEEWALSLLYRLCWVCRNVRKKTKCCQHLNKNIKFVLFAKKNTEKYSQIMFEEFCSLSKLGNDKAGHFGGETWDQHSKRWLPTKSHIGLYSLSSKLFSIKLKLLMKTFFW